MESLCPFPTVICLANWIFSESCGRFFTRVVEVNHGELNQVPGLAESSCSENVSDEDAYTRFHESKSISPQTRPGMGSLPSISGYDSDDEDVRGFVRVHLVSKKNQSDRAPRCRRRVKPHHQSRKRSHSTSASPTQHAGVRFHDVFWHILPSRSRRTTKGLQTKAANFQPESSCCFS